MSSQGDATLVLVCVLGPGAYGFGGARLAKEGIQPHPAPATVVTQRLADEEVQRIPPTVATDVADLAGVEHWRCGPPCFCSLARSEPRAAPPLGANGWLRGLALGLGPPQHLRPGKRTGCMLTALMVEEWTLELHGARPFGLGATPVAAANMTAGKTFAARDRTWTATLLPRARSPHRVVGRPFGHPLGVMPELTRSAPARTARL